MRQEHVPGGEYYSGLANFSARWVLYCLAAQRVYAFGTQQLWVFEAFDSVPLDTIGQYCLLCRNTSKRTRIILQTFRLVVSSVVLSNDVNTAKPVGTRRDRVQDTDEHGGGDSTPRQSWAFDGDALGVLPTNPRDKPWGADAVQGTTSNPTNTYCCTGHRI